MNISKQKACTMSKKQKNLDSSKEFELAGDMTKVNPLSKKFYKSMRSELKTRVSEKRMKHIDGVADTAEQIALVHGLDPDKARLAGLLHDWDKGMNNEQIRQRAYDLGLKDEIGEWVIENMPEVIHGISASHALKRKYPQIPDDVIHAIKVHTTACESMSDLDKVLYIADAIEPGRKFDSLPDLRAMIDTASLDDLYFEVYKFWTESLIKRGRALHPDTIRIWNDCCISRRNS